MYILPFLVSTIVAVLSSRCPPRCPLLMHLPLSSDKPLATLPAVHHSCCPLLPLSSPSVVRSSYETKQKPAKHCSSPFHLTPSFTFYTLPLSSSDRFCPSFLIFPDKQDKDDIPKETNKYTPPVHVGQVLPVLFNIS